MFFRTLLLLVFAGGLIGTPLAAQSGANPCADLAKKHLATLDDHLDLDYGQMKCLKEVAERFCAANKGNRPTTDAQRANRRKKLRASLLRCLSPAQQQRVKTAYRNQRDKQRRRDILQAFVEEFGDEVIILGKRN